MMKLEDLLNPLSVSAKSLYKSFQMNQQNLLWIVDYLTFGLKNNSFDLGAQYQIFGIIPYQFEISQKINIIREALIFHTFHVGNQSIFASYAAIQLLELLKKHHEKFKIFLQFYPDNQVLVRIDFDNQSYIYNPFLQLHELTPLKLYQSKHKSKPSQEYLINEEFLNYFESRIEIFNAYMQEKIEMLAIPKDHKTEFNEIKELLGVKKRGFKI